MKKYNFDEFVNREQTDSVKYDLRQLLFGNENLIPMWVADMDFKTPDFIIDALKERLNHEILGYSFRGDDYHTSIIHWMKESHRWNIEKEWITYSPGVVPAVNMLVMAFTKPGDEIIVQPPVYYPFFTAIENNGRKISENPLKLENGRLAMDFDDLRQKAKTAKMMIISSPHNPGGSVWTKEELLEMATICMENKVLMISDEIHSDLLLFGHHHTPLATLSEEIANSTITCNAASKTFNIAGLATSYLIISNPELLKKYHTILNDQVHINMGNVFGPIATQAAYEYGREWLNQLKSYLEKNILFAVDYFKKEIPQIKVVMPESTYMLWLDCSKLNLNDEQLAEFFIHKANLGFNKGITFRTGGEGFMRMNLACPIQGVQKALEQLKSAILEMTV